MEEKGKKLRLHNLVGFGVGNTIGTGIFVMLGFGIAATGRSIPLAMLASCVFMLLSTWAIVGMSTMFVFKGGDYAMKTMLFNPTMTGVNAFFTVINAFGFGSLALAFAQYLCVLFPGLTPYTKALAIISLAIMFLITVFGSRAVTLVENWITVVLLVALVLFVGVGILHVNPTNFFDNSYDGGLLPFGVGGFVSAVSLMSYVCMGQTAPVSLAAVTENPKRTVPMSMFIIALVTGGIYALMAYVAAGVLPYDQIAGANLSVTAEAIFSQPLYLFFVVGGGLCAIASSILSSLGYLRYPLNQVADEGWLPSIFKRRDKNGYPYVTYILLFILSVIPLALDMNIDTMVSLTMIPMMLINAYLNISCITLPKKFPAQWEKRSIRLPLAVYNVCCVLGTAAALCVSWNLFTGMTVQEMIFTVIMLIALLALSTLRIRQKAVSAEFLAAQREKIVQEALDQ